MRDRWATRRTLLLRQLLGRDVLDRKIAVDRTIRAVRFFVPEDDGVVLIDCLAFAQIDVIRTVKLPLPRRLSAPFRKIGGYNNEVAQTECVAAKFGRRGLCRCMNM